MPTNDDARTRLIADLRAIVAAHRRIPAYMQTHHAGLPREDVERAIEAAADVLDADAERIRELKAERDRYKGAAEDWQLAADGIKHHFHCINNVVTGDPNGIICDRCRAQHAESEVSRLTDENARLQVERDSGAQHKINKRRNGQK